MALILKAPCGSGWLVTLATHIPAGRCSLKERMLFHTDNAIAKARK